MSYFVVDVESDGPIIGFNSMVCFGIVKVDDKLDKTFYGKTKPISDKYIEEALAISGFTRKEHEKFDDPVNVMSDCYDWIMANNTSKGIILLSDNNGYDASWINYYFLRFAPQGKNPFGWSSRRIGDIYCGMKMDARAQWKHLRKTIHDHNPVNDAIGNPEALLAMRDMGLKIDFK